MYVAAPTLKRISHETTVSLAGPPPGECGSAEPGNQPLQSNHLGGVLGIQSNCPGASSSRGNNCLLGKVPDSDAKEPRGASVEILNVAKKNTLRKLGA